MQQMSALIENLFIFLVIIIIGYAIGATKKVHPTLKADLSFLLLKVTLPFMVIDAVVQPYNGALIKQGLWTFVFSSIGFLVCWLVSYIFMKILRVEEKKQGVWQLAGTFSNIGYMGFPVIGAMFGANGLFLATFANIAYNLFYFSIGAVMIAGGKGKTHFNWRSVLFNNIMVALYVGLILYFAKIEFPSFISGTLSTVGNMTGPLSMLIIGLKLSDYPLKELFNNLSQYQLSFVRLIAAPLIVVLLLQLVPKEGNELMIAVLAILNAMPIAGNTTIMAVQYGGDAEFAAKSTTLSSIICLVTTPIIFMLI
jgi:malate permease and related proteins